ncbi:hypothetical protein FB451DRAFT_1269050, partial [Mycena latifolia]
MLPPSASASSRVGALPLGLFCPLPAFVPVATPTLRHFIAILSSAAYPSCGHHRSLATGCAFRMIILFSPSPFLAIPCLRVPPRIIHGHTFIIRPPASLPCSRPSLRPFFAPAPAPSNSKSFPAADSFFLSSLIPYFSSPRTTRRSQHVPDMDVDLPPLPDDAEMELDADSGEGSGSGEGVRRVSGEGTLGAKRK